MLMPTLRKVDLREKFQDIDKHWSPRIAAELNGQHVKLVKFAGDFVWHKHDAEDELFLVVEGSFRMEYRAEDGAETALELGAGQFVVVPRGVEHRPVAEREVSVLLFEPASTLNTGDAADARRVDAPEWA
jgi:mannose-6-phosphate isomerase-like protein (cupin superfamily)